ncbi:MAG: sulfurtransferase [Actinomycetota bacterium]|nr:sulfurtransferase [Actinomycetota bacterium]
MTEQLLIDPVGLAAELNGPLPPVVLDVRWTLAGPQRAAYLAGHIPGAVFIDLDADLAAPPGADGRHPLPEPAALQRLWRSVGISDDTSVVVYDGANSSIAARAWWLLRWSGHDDVRVLDGGYPGWQRAGLGSATGGLAVDPGSGTAVVQPGGMSTVDIDGAAAAGESSDQILLDARAPERYRGETEPVDPVAGHIPGAVNLPLTDLVTAIGTFRPVQELVARFTAAGLSATDAGTPAPVAVASCGSGVTACHLILAGRIAGLDLALYPGSYSGWCAAHRPVATGP